MVEREVVFRESWWDCGEVYGWRWTGRDEKGLTQPRGRGMERRVREKREDEPESERKTRLFVDAEHPMLLPSEVDEV